MLELFRLRRKERPVNTLRVHFGDFEPSLQPGNNPPSCKACNSVLSWKPANYLLEARGIMYSARIGWWKCPNGHPGKVYIKDFERFGKRIQEHFARQDAFKSLTCD